MDKAMDDKKSIINLPGKELISTVQTYIDNSESLASCLDSESDDPLVKSRWNPQSGHCQSKWGDKGEK